MSNENAKIDDNYKKSLTAITDDAVREIRRLLVDPITGRLKVQITGANKSKKQEVFNETGGTLSQNRFVKVVGDNNLYLIPNVDYVSSLNDTPVGFLTVDFLDGSRAEPLIRGRVEIAGFDTSTANIGDPVYSDENGNPTLFPTGLEVGQVLTPSTNGVVFINLGAKTDIVEKMTTATDPATNAAVTQTIVDHFIGVIITLTTTGNSQTIASPTLVSSIGRKFTVVNDDTSTNSIVVNGQTIEIGEATTFMWDGSAWIYVDINENLFEIVGGVIRPITDGDNLDMRTGTITTPTLYANIINEKTLNSGVTVDGVLIKDGEVDGRDISVDGSALDSHISNTLNPHSVTATQVGLGNVTNESKATMFTNPTFTGHVTVPTPTDGTDAVTKNYADNLVVGLWDDRGSYDASGNTFPATGGSGTAGAILKGDIWTISVAGTLGGVAVDVGDTVRAVTDNPGQTSSNWALLENNIGYVPENIANKVVLISALSTDTEYPSAKCIFDELALKQNVLSKASGAEIDTGTDNDKYVTSKAIADSKISFTDGVETLTNKTIDLDDNTILNAGNILVGENLLDNSNFINNSSNGYGAYITDDWIFTYNVCQGGFPECTRQQMVDSLGILDANIIGLWNLNEESGDAIDLSSNGYNLSNFNTSIGSKNGLMTYARLFNGTNQYLASYGANLFTMSSTTFACIIRPEAIALKYIMEINGAATDGHYLRMNADGTITFNVNGLSASITSDVKMTANMWYNIVATYTGTTLTLTINGITKTLSITGAMSNTSLGEFDIGCDYLKSIFFNGYIQNAVVLNTALNTMQAKKLWYMTNYKGIKLGSNIHDATDTAYCNQVLTEEQRNKIQGKTLTLVIKTYSTGTNTVMIGCTLDNVSISQKSITPVANTWEIQSLTFTVPDKMSYVNLQYISLVKNTPDTVFFKEGMLYEGITPVAFWNASQNDWQRFPRLMRMDPPADLNGGYHFEENRWYNFISTLTGFSSITLNSISYKFVGNMCYLDTGNDNRIGGISNSSVFTFTVPANNVVYKYGVPCFIMDNDTIQANPGSIEVQAGNVMNVHKTFYNGAWTASNIKLLYIPNFSYTI